MPTVSVIVPNYNHARYLEQRIASILAQTFQDFELLLLDDHSTDESREIMLRYREHPKVKTLMFNDQNSGSPFPQWDRGIGHSSGEFVWIAESDDWCEPTFLETLVHALRSDADCAVAYAQTFFADEAGNIQGKTEHTQTDRTMDGVEFISTMLLPYCLLCNASMAVFRRSAYASVSADYKNYKMCGDWLFWIGAASKGTVYISGQTLNYFRKHRQHVSGSMYATGENFVEELNVLRAARELGVLTRKRLSMIIRDRYLDYVGLRSRFGITMRGKIEQVFFAGESSYFKMAAITSAACRIAIGRLIRRARWKAK